MKHQYALSSSPVWCRQCFFHDEHQFLQSLSSSIYEESFNAHLPPIRETPQPDSYRYLGKSYGFRHFRDTATLHHVNFNTCNWEPKQQHLVAEQKWDSNFELSVTQIDKSIGSSTLVERHLLCEGLQSMGLVDTFLYHFTKSPVTFASLSLNFLDI